jgi:type IV pilus biogenesis protein CpaD/CtpE
MGSPAFAALLLLVAAVAAGCASPAAGATGPIDPRTRIPPGIRQEWLHFTDPVVKEGDPAPGFELATPDGRTTLSLRDFSGRPLVLVFGSWT